MITKKEEEDSVEQIKLKNKFDTKFLTEFQETLAKKHGNDDKVSVEIIDNIFLGSLASAMNLKNLQTNKITHILTIIDVVSFPFPEV